MNALKTWAISLAGAWMCAAVFSYLKPSAKFDKVLKIALFAFLIIAMITPFSGIGDIRISDWFSSTRQSDEIEQKGEDFLMQAQINAAAENVKKEVAERLQKKGFSYQEIRVSMNIDSDNNIFINEIAVTGVPASKRQGLHDFIKKELALEVTVS